MRKTYKFLLAVLLTFWVGAAWAQTHSVSGKVTDSGDGSPLPGVNVVVKGTTQGTSTDASGKFTLANVPDNATLVFSFIGFLPEEVSAGTKTTIDVKLLSDVKALQEIVVTGVGVATDKKKLGISVESITASKLPAAPTASIDQALIGKIPGAQISSVSGNPGDPVNIVLRGINTVQNGTKPLIMVDGVQLFGTDLNSLDLSNIERVEVVQGAASSTIYGAQGANGVIQIFTKKGKQGHISVNVSSSYSANQFINSGDLHKARKHPYITDDNNNVVDNAGNVLQYNEYGTITGISYLYGLPNNTANGNGATRYAILDPRNVADKDYGANLKYYDHFKQMFKTGSTWNHSINISGGSEKTDFSISLANNNTVSPVMKNGSVDRTNLTANVGTELLKGLKIRSTTQLVYTKNDLHPGLGGAGGSYYGQGNSLGGVGRVYSFLNTSPFFDLTYKLADGTYPRYQTADFVSINASNPYYQQAYSSSLDNKIDIIQSFNATYTVNKFLDLDAKYGINYRNENAKWTYYNQSQNINAVHYKSWSGQFASANTGEIDNWQYNNTFQNFLATAFIKTDFEKDFNLSIPIQTSTQISFDYRKNKYTEYDTYGLGLPLAPPINMRSTASQAVALDYVKTFVTYGYLINQKIDFGDFGGVTGGFRSDWSSAFGGGSKPFTFPHFDGYLLPSSFWKENPIAYTIPYFKLRAAYGQAGIQPDAFDRYPTLSQQNLGSQVVYSIPEISKNPDLKVEVSKEFEVGTDFTVDLHNGKWFKSINGSFSYWKRASENVIYTVSTAPTTGSTGLKNNAIGLSSNGVQFSLNIPVYASGDLTWDFTTNFGHQVSKIDNISGGADIILTSGAGDAALVLTPGQIIGQIYGYKALTSLDYKRKDGTRYIAETNEDQYEIVDGRVVNKAKKQIQFADEKTPLANPNPKFNASFINAFSYKNFLTFSFQFDWIYGSHIYNQTKEWMYRDGIHGDFEKPVTINGETGAYSAYYASAYYALWGSDKGAGNLATKDYFLEDASFLRLRNISLGVDLNKFIKVPALKKVQLVFTGRNLLTVTKYTGMDPEISSGASNSSFDRGVDHSTLPNTKSYQVALNIGF
ncbi:SusC/RagA family TonB-linked outer membrane protein [Cytophagaceae bacterium DM2B3-1]|uniref:SusC/RagA family TonB-linked outer membrane protein n=1 Tax=Xanthocytophaga flava TaxID=3048013 RepID=A0ABT7CQ80_9BACT|nr:SusC/RagA family TonB-linked outer membrane protein [Xanthocytophaga flavus]MDJ1495902.1 SusC/RagA family TonB-linked outer membrane protein [Xanthocytophaga flavus]